ncbi:MAG: antitoxin YefM [Gammaproteobacteria bacterium]|jgi:antitoxin YefM
MTNLSMAEFRSKLAKYIDTVAASHKPLFITRGKNKPGFVVLSEEDYHSMLETNYLLRSPKNAERLLHSIENVNKGKFKEHALSE